MSIFNHNLKTKQDSPSLTQSKGALGQVGGGPVAHSVENQGSTIWNIFFLTRETDVVTDIIPVKAGQEGRKNFSISKHLLRAPGRLSSIKHLTLAFICQEMAFLTHLVRPWGALEGRYQAKVFQGA